MMRSKVFLWIVMSAALFNCRTSHSIQKTEVAEYIFSDSGNVAQDTAVTTFIEPYKKKMEGEMNAIIGESEIPMEKGTPEGLLGDYVADACMREGAKAYYPQDNSKIDFAFFNNGGLRRALPRGEITRGNVFELMPFENELVVLTADGSTVKKIFNFIASKDGAPVSGTSFKISNHAATDIMINKAPLDT